MAHDYYVLSINHTRQSDRVLTWWGPDDSGYVFRLENAGRYSEKRVAANLSYYDNRVHTRAVRCDIVEAKAEAVAGVVGPTINVSRSGTDLVVRFRHRRGLIARGGVR